MISQALTHRPHYLNQQSSLKRIESEKRESYDDGERTSSKIKQTDEKKREEERRQVGRQGGSYDRTMRGEGDRERMEREQQS